MPLLEADFLACYSLMVDVGYCCLADSSSLPSSLIVATPVEEVTAEVKWPDQ